MPANVISDLKEEYAGLTLAVLSSSSSEIMVWLANSLGKRVMEKVWEVRLWSSFVASWTDSRLHRVFLASCCRPQAYRCPCRSGMGRMESCCIAGACQVVPSRLSI